MTAKESFVHWYKHHLGDYASDTQGLTLTEHGAYRLLLDAYYSNNGPLPCDSAYLYRLCRAHRTHEKRAVDRVLKLFFLNSDSTVKNPRADEEIVKYQAQCAANRRRIVGESGLQPETNNQKPEKTTSTTGRKRPLPDDFKVSERVAAWAGKRRIENLDRHVEYFVGYARANGKTYADWDQALMNAIRDDWAKIGDGRKRVAI